MSDKKFDFDDTWDPLLEKLLQSGVQVVVDEIRKEDDPEKRNAWLGFFSQGLAFRDWENRNLDDMVAVGEAAVKDALNQAETSDQSEYWIDNANRHCYNISANLADCWRDGFAREKRHFEKGLALANHAIEYRVQLKKGPASLSMAYWAKGKHLLSLGNYKQAEEAYKTTLEFDLKEYKLDQEKIQTLNEDMPFSILLDAGFLGLAQAKQNKDQGKERFEEAVRIFKLWESIDAKKGEGELGVMELEESMKLN